MAKLKNREKKRLVMIKKSNLKGKNIREKYNHRQQFDLKRKKNSKGNSSNRGRGKSEWKESGLDNKDIHFWKYIKKFDIIGILKTWIEEKRWKSLKDYLPGEFRWRCQFARREKNRGRAMNEDKSMENYSRNLIHIQQNWTEEGIKNFRENLEYIEFERTTLEESWNELKVAVKQVTEKKEIIMKRGKIGERK
ncbi:hypothetical protein P5V15_014018 [Pogonomyrmex californicus]